MRTRSTITNTPTQIITETHTEHAKWIQPPIEKEARRDLPQDEELLQINE